MIKLKIDNVYTEIRGASKSCEAVIWDKLAFDIAEFNAPFLKRRHLFNRKTKKTYTGLLDQVIEILDNRGEEYTIEDNRIAWEPNANFKLVEYLDEAKTIKLQARPYQQDIIDRATNREVIQAATGAGKTFMMAGLMAKFNVKPISIFADKMTLCSQLRDEFSKFLGVPVGLVGGGINDKRDITVYSIQSAQPEDVKDSKMILFDECLKGDTLVTLVDNSKLTIQEIVENKMNVEVITYNTKKKIFEPNKIYNWQKIPLNKKNKRMVKIIIEDENNNNYTIECTEDHKIWVESKNKYIEAGKLIFGMEVIYNNRKYKCSIKSIEFIDSIDYVYDISVENNHNFIANNIVVSNCHHVPAATMNTIAAQCTNAYYRIGVSATPWRDAGDEMLIEAVLAKRKPENNINASKLIELGYLTNCTIYMVPHKLQFKGKNYNKVYNEAIVENKVRNKTIVRICEKMYKTKGCKTLILIKNVKHGETLLEMVNNVIESKEKLYSVVNDKGKEFKIRVKNIEFLSGKDDAMKRKAVIQAAKEGFVDVLIGSTIADEGLDIPRLDCLILGGGGRSSTRAFQRIGRVLRLYPGKTRGIVFDFEDATPMLRKHSDIRKKLYRTEPKWELKYFNLNLLKK